MLEILSFLRLSAKFSAGEIFGVWADVAQIHPQPAAEGEEDPPGDLLNTNNNFGKSFNLFDLLKTDNNLWSFLKIKIQVMMCEE